MASQESKGPSIAELQKFVREKTNLEFVLINGQTVYGILRWFDEHCFSVQDATGGITLVRTSVIGYRPKF
jgi:hypothetical protein